MMLNTPETFCSVCIMLSWLVRCEFQRGNERELLKKTKFDKCYILDCRVIRSIDWKIVIPVVYLYYFVPDKINSIKRNRF